jgi:hypothetical protein
MKSKGSLSYSVALIAKRPLGVAALLSKLSVGHIGGAVRTVSKPPAGGNLKPRCQPGHEAGHYPAGFRGADTEHDRLIRRGAARAILIGALRASKARSRDGLRAARSRGAERIARTATDICRGMWK